MSRRRDADRDAAWFVLSLFGLVLCAYAALLIMAFGRPIYPSICDTYRGAECAAAVEGR